VKTKLAGSYYRLGLAAAKRRDLSAALRYASYAALLDLGHDDAARLAEICRRELGGDGDDEPGADPRGDLKKALALTRQKKWAAAARETRKIPHPSVRLLNMQGCLWALAKRGAPAADCFARALEKDRGNLLAREALACLGRRQTLFWRFF
jgi:hypothetical protein